MATEAESMTAALEAKAERGFNNEKGFAVSSGEYSDYR